MKAYDRMEILEVLNDIGISYKEENGQAKFEKCPFCEVGKNLKDSDQYKHFSVNLETGQYYCHHRNSCGEQGGFYTLKDKLGLSPISSTKKIYMKPKENKAIKTPEDRFYDWYESNRGIKRNVLEKYQVSSMAIGQDRYMVYRYLDNNGKEFNRKYRHISDKKKMWTEKGCEQGFYGQQFFDPEKAPFLIVVEGEDDVHAMAQYGIGAVSVPFGAGAFSPSMMDYCNQFDAIYLALDNDTAGEVGAKRFAERVGFDKCTRVKLPRKDARQCLLDGVTSEEIKEAIGSGKQYEHDSIGCINTGDADEMWNYISGETAFSGIFTPYKAFNSLLRGIRFGEMTIITGTTGSGKTTFGDNLLHCIEEQGYPVMAFHFENKPLAIKCKLIEVRTGVTVSEYDEENNRRVPKVEEDWYRNEVENLAYSNWYLYKVKKDSKGYCDLDELTNVMKYANKVYGVRHFLIDHLHYFLKTSKSNNPTATIDEAVREIRQLSVELDSHFFMAVHPTKVGSDKNGKQNKVGLDSAKGSSSIAQEADNYVVVDKVAEGVSSVSIEKVREDGKEGTCYFKVKGGFNHFYDCTKENPLENGGDIETVGFV